MEPAPPPQPQPPVSDMRARAATGASILVLVNLVSRGLGIFSIAVLARLLTPDDFGIVSLAMIVVEFAQMLTDFQLINALVRHPARDEHLYATAFTMAILRGLVTAAGIALAAVPAALILHSGHIRDVLLVLAIVPFIDGLRSPRMVDYLREIDFSRDVTVTMIGRVTGLVVMVVTALLTHSYWALVAGTVSASIAMCAATHLFKPFAPRFGLRDYRLFLGFGGWMSIAAVTNYASSKLDGLIVAGHFSIARFGQYNLGVQISTIVTNQLADPFQRAVFSTLSSIHGDLQRRLAAYLQAQETMLGLLLPVGLGLMLVAHEAIIVIAGPKWTGAIIVMQFLAPPMALATVTVAAQALLMAEGDTRTVFIRNLITMAVRVSALWIGIVWFGLIGLLVGAVLSGLFYLFITLHLVTRRYHISPLTLFRNTSRVLAATGAMVAAVSLLGWAIGTPPDHDFIRNLIVLVAKALVGGCVYIGVLASLWRMKGRPAGFERFFLEFLMRTTAPLRRRLMPRRS